MVAAAKSTSGTWFSIKSAEILTGNKKAAGFTQNPAALSLRITFA
jgi:hypothetical protein